MFNNGCKTIGMLISGVSSTFQKFLCKELTDLCLDMGYNLAIFNVFGGSSYEDVEAYAVGEANILNLIPYEEFAGLITVPDTFVSKSLRNNVVETIKKRVTCPVVSVRTQIDGFYSLVIDNTVAMNDMISHFIEKHGKTKIAFLNGPKDHPEAIDRLTSYRNTMAKYNIPVREDWILYGDFWLNLGGYYADYYFKDKEKSEWPEVIVCANDYMAIAVCDECLKRGIKIPEEVMVSGFDNLPETMSCYPLISTVEVSI